MPGIVLKGDDPSLARRFRQKKSGATQGDARSLSFGPPGLPQQAGRKGDYMPLL
jgi:hypothetical protein